jgi:predicted acyltransferase
MGTTNPPVAPARLTSLDAFRGLTMLYMVSEIWRLPAVARSFPDSAIWQFIAWHTNHVQWAGGSAWDMIQPAFTFMVGVALPWSVANRRARGQGLRHLWLHALWRSVVLVALGVFLRSTSRPTTNFTFEDTLSQIGLGYLILFLLAWQRVRIQVLALVVILVGYWAAFALYPAPGPGFDWRSVGVAADWPYHLQGFAAHWDKNSNLAAAFDVWFLNLLPRERPFVFNGGGYLTLSFIPTLGTMILGLLTGGLLRSERSTRDKLRWLAGAGAAGILAGWLLGATGICPVVKRIWTPSWVLYSGGWVTLALAATYWVIDVRGKRRWAYGLCAVGMNSIAMYCMEHLWSGFVGQSFRINLGWNLLKPLTPPWSNFVPMLLAWGVLWWVCIWMDRRKLYIRI